MKSKRAERALKGTAFLVCLTVGQNSVTARTIGVGESVLVSGSDGVVDSWELSSGASLLLTEGAKSKYVRLDRASLSMVDASIDSVFGMGVQAGPGSTVNLERSTVNDADGEGVHVAGKLEPSTLVMTDSRASGGSAGAVLGGAALLIARRSALVSAGDQGVGLSIAGGSAELHEGSEVRGVRAGAEIGPRFYASSGPRSLLVTTGSVVRASSGPALSVVGNDGDSFPVEISIRDGGTLLSGNGNALEVRGGAKANFSLKNSSVVGDVAVSRDSGARVVIGEGGFLQGAITGPSDVSLGRAGIWSLSADSQITSLAFDGGGIAFAAGERKTRMLRVTESVNGVAGSLSLNVHMEAANRADSWADKLLVERDVDVLRPIDLVVNMTGTPFGTDTDGNGLVGSNEGLSLVQVGGTSTPEAFRLVGGYASLGAFQYELAAFQGDDVAHEQGQLEGRPAAWDYRLVSRKVCEGHCGDGSDGTGGDPGNDSGHDKSRPAVVPEIASYISVPGAIFAYANGISTSLHERLGEIRDNGFGGKFGAELFARFSGKNQRYNSNRSFAAYGYDFDQTIEAWQFGGSLIGLDGDNGSVRAGWAIDRGRSSIVPRAVDGDSMTRLRANGTSAWVTWRSGNGFWLDGIVSQQRMRGRTDTSRGGKDVGRIRAAATGLSLAAGLPFQIGPTWMVEPHVNVSTQYVRVNSIVGKDRLSVSFGGRRFVSTTAGISVARTDEALAPFLRLDISSSAGNGLVNASSGGTTPSRFVAGRGGSEYMVAGGVTARITPRLYAFGEGGYRHFLGSNGFQGWNGHVGLRMTF